MKKTLSIACMAVVMAQISSPFAQDDLSRTQEALRLISSTAAELCDSIKQEGQISETQLSGDANAKLNGALSKFIDLGIKGSGNVKSSQYNGVLQEQLAKTLKEARDCRQEIYRDLVKRLLPSQPVVYPPPPPPTRLTPPPPPVPPIQPKPLPIGFVGNWRLAGKSEIWHIAKDGSISWDNGYGRILAEGSGAMRGDKLVIAFHLPNGQSAQGELALTMGGQMLDGNFGPPVSGRMSLRKSY